MFKRILVFMYGAGAYVMFLGVFVYAIGFIGGFATPTTLDGDPGAPMTVALLTNVALLTVFALQHSVMARRGFKQVWTRVVPEAAERSTYVLFTNLALIALFVFWQPMGGTVWRIEHPAGAAIVYGLYAMGWLTVLATTFLINHFDLFGLRQATLYLMGKPYTPLRFRTPGPYKHVRHPLYVGWLMVFWFTPHMTAAHFVFAAMTTAYILVAIQFEERDLVAMHGKEYRDYRNATPMLVPRIGKASAAAEEPMAKEPMVM